MKKICVFTSTRADYGILKNLIKKLNEENNFQINLLVSGSHLSESQGYTYKEIEADKIKINEKIEILLDSDSSFSVSKSMGLALISFSDYFKRTRPDLLIVLGDRFETLSVAIAAYNSQIPIAHIHGGEKTEGALDEGYRHSITKLSSLHFTSTEEYRKRVIQLGENPKKVFNVGALGVENILEMKFLSKKELSKELSLDLSKPYAIVTYHPATLEKNIISKKVNELLKVISLYEKINFYFTKANSDAGGKIINSILDDFVLKNNNCKIFSSLGSLRYLSLAKYSEFVIGNSSSGIIEIPSFNIPTIDVGSRQMGRATSKSVIHCDDNFIKINEAVKKALSLEFRTSIKKTKNPYEKKDTSKKIIETLKIFLLEEKSNLLKEFFDIKKTD